MAQTTESSAPTAPRPPAPTEPVMVGYDGKEGGRDALELGRVLASIRRTRCVVAVPELDGVAAEAREALEDSGADVFEIGVIAPGRMLPEYAKRKGAGTLVVGSTRRGPVGRALQGSAAEQVLRTAPCEVVVAPRGYADERHDGLSLIAVAVDGSPESEAARSRAEDLARQAGASVEAVVAGDHERHEAKATAAGIIAACDPGVDLLVAGCRDALEHLMSGSVTRQLIRQAPCPVLIIPPHAR